MAGVTEAPQVDAPKASGDRGAAVADAAAQASAPAAAAARVIDPRYANMGVVGEVAAPTLDLDAALRRRRAV